MADPFQPSDVLLDILNVLQRIEARLEGHEERFKRLEEPNYTSINGTETEDSESRALTSQNGDQPINIQSLDFFSGPRPSRKGTPSNEDLSEDTKTALKIPYGEWNLNQLDRFFNIDLAKLLERRLGDCWKMPDDDRLPLKFFRSNVLKSNTPSWTPADSFPTARQPFERELEFLCHFDEVLRKQPGNDFLVVDFDAWDDTRIYRVGDEAIGAELQVEAQGSQTAPWSRLMFASSPLLHNLNINSDRLAYTRARQLGIAFRLIGRGLSSPYHTSQAQIRSRGCGTI